MQKQSDNQLILQTTTECIKESQAMQFLTLGNRLGWHTEVLGKAPMVETPVRLQDWLLVPAHEDATKLPHRTMKRIETIYSQGLRPKGFVVVHEAPMQLKPPEQTNSQKAELKLSNLDLAKGLEALVKVAGIVMMATLLLPVGLLTIIDPIMVVVTEDDYWIEIDRWIS